MFALLASTPSFAVDPSILWCIGMPTNALRFLGWLNTAFGQSSSITLSLYPFARVKVMALSALSLLSFLTSNQVVFCKLVPMNAMCFLGVLGCYTLATMIVDFRRYWFQMIGIAAGRIPAKVIDLQSFRDRPALQFPDQPVNRPSFFVQIDLSVRRRWIVPVRTASLPFPAAVLLLINESVDFLDGRDAMVCSLWFSFHTISIPHFSRISILGKT